MCVCVLYFSVIRLLSHILNLVTRREHLRNTHTHIYKYNICAIAMHNDTKRNVSDIDMDETVENTSLVFKM